MRESQTTSKTSGDRSTEASTRGAVGPSVALAVAVTEANPTPSGGLPADMDGGYPDGTGPRSGAFSTIVQIDDAPA